MKKILLNFKTLFIILFCIIIYSSNSQFLSSLVLFPNDDGSIQIQHQITAPEINNNKTDNSNIPQNYKLYDNYPDPFVTVNYIKFDIPEAGKIKLEVFDIKGHLVNTLINKYLFAGSYSIKWDVSEHPEGAYFYKLTSRDFCKSKAMLIIK